MSEKQTINREEFLKSINLVRPALASQAFVVSLTHVAFDDGMVMAYNDITSIGVACKFEYDVCLPGDLLIKILNSLSADELMVQKPDEATLQFVGGRSKFKIPLLQLDTFPFVLPDSPILNKIKLTPDLISGIEKCLISVGTDPTHPAQMGVTLEEGGVLYSTNNFSISRYQSSSDIKLAAGAPVILPTYFCQQLISLSRAFPKEPVEMEVRDTSITVWFGDDIYLFTKLGDNDPLDFSRIIKKHCSDAAIKEHAATIPEAFDSAFERALLIVADDLDRSSQITIDEEKLRIVTRSKTSSSETDDSMRFKGGAEVDEEFYVDPALVIKASKICNKMAALKDVLVLTNEDLTFIHLIAHHSA